MAAQEGLPKYERICKEKDVELLFGKGQGISVYPYRVIFLFRHDESHPVTVRLLVSVSKKRFHHAVSRNHVKRLMREAWRKNRQMLTSQLPEGKIVYVAFIWTAGNHLSSVEVEKRVISILRRITEKAHTS